MYHKQSQTSSEQPDLKPFIMLHNSKNHKPHNPNKAEHETQSTQWESESKFSPHGARSSKSSNLVYYRLDGLTNSHLGLHITWSTLFHGGEIRCCTIVMVFLTVFVYIMYNMLYKRFPWFSIVLASFLHILNTMLPCFSQHIIYEQ